jgi:hypothetical protein
MQKKKFTETDIFRESSTLLRIGYEKIKNVPTDARKVFGLSFLDHLRKCNEYSKICYKELKDSKKLKYVFICKANYEIEMAESNLNDMVSAGFLQGKQKENETREVYLNGGSEISKHLGCLMIQITDFKKSLEESLTPEEIEQLRLYLFNV